MYGGNRNYIHKAELRKTLYIECMQHKQQLKIFFFGRKAQYEAVAKDIKYDIEKDFYFACVFSVSPFYVREWYASSCS